MDLKATRESLHPKRTPTESTQHAGSVRQLPEDVDCGEVGTYNLSDVKSVAVESGLGVLPLENSSRAKVRNIMSALYTHAQRWELTNRNPTRS